MIPIPVRTRSWARLTVAIAATGMAMPLVPTTPDEAVLARADVLAAFADITPSSELTGATLLTGTVVGNGGEETQVYVYVNEPDTGPLRRDLIPVALVASTTDRFVARADPDVELPTYKVSGGSARIVDFMVVAISDTHRGVYRFSRQLDVEGDLLPAVTGGETVATEPAPGHGDTAAALSTIAVANAHNIATPSRHVRLLMHARSVSDDTSSTARAGGGHEGDPYCVRLSRHPNRLTHIASAFHNASVARQTATYWRESVSNLGVALKFSDGWEAWGTLDREVKQGNGVSWTTKRRHKRYLDSRMEYRKYRCATYYPGDPQPDYERFFEPYRHEGGQSSRRGVPAPNAPARYCRRGEDNTSFTKVDTKATRWTNGVKVGGIISIDLSVRTGYTETTGIKTRFYRNGWTCGVFDVPFGAPGLVVYQRRQA